MYFDKNNAIKVYKEVVYLFIALGMLQIICTLTYDIGVIANRLVVAYNGQKMPVFCGFDSVTGKSYGCDNDNIHYEANEKTKLPWLGDWIKMRQRTAVDKFLLKIFRVKLRGFKADNIIYASPGDILIGVGESLDIPLRVMNLFFFAFLGVTFIFGENFMGPE